jgi:polycystin 1L2
LIKVGRLTNHSITQCFSTHLTSFVGGFVVLPEPVNWNYVFANADFQKNKTVYLTIICVSILYLILLIYARFKDKQDLEKLGVTSLPDNHKSDQYFYQIIVFTGQRKDSGTKSKVKYQV